MHGLFDAWIRPGLVGLGLWLVCSVGQAQTPTPTPPPAWASPVLRGLYARYLPDLAHEFVKQADRLVSQTRQHCTDPTSNATLREAWQQTLLAWSKLSSPTLVPVTTRQSQRMIDFWPALPSLVDASIAKAPQTMDDLVRIGTPAKGLPAIDDLLLRDLHDEATCHYLELLTQNIAAEAQGLEHDLRQMASQDWSPQDDATAEAFTEWGNQWLGGLDRLRWMQIEQPVQRARTRPQQFHGQPPFPRLRAQDNRVEWRVRWQALLAQARTSAQVRNGPIPIEILLRTQGKAALADRWATALDAITQELDQLPTPADDASLLHLSRTMKVVSQMYLDEVAQALGILIDFSGKDGD